MVYDKMPVNGTLLVMHHDGVKPSRCPLTVHTMAEMAGKHYCLHTAAKSRSLLFRYIRSRDGQLLGCNIQPNRDNDTYNLDMLESTQVKNQFIVFSYHLWRWPPLNSDLQPQD